MFFFVYRDAISTKSATAKEVEVIVRENEVVAATISILDGIPCIVVMLAI